MEVCRMAIQTTKVGSKLEPLASIKNPKVYKTVKESISRFHSVLGVRQKDIKIRTTGGWYGWSAYFPKWSI